MCHIFSQVTFTLVRSFKFSDWVIYSAELKLFHSHKCLKFSNEVLSFTQHSIDETASQKTAALQGFTLAELKVQR